VFALTSVNEQIFVSVRLGGAAGIKDDQLMIVLLMVFVKSCITVFNDDQDSVFNPSQE